MADAQVGEHHNLLAVAHRHAAGLVAGAQQQVVQGYRGGGGGVAAGDAAHGAGFLSAAADGAAWRGG